MSIRPIPGASSVHSAPPSLPSLPAALTSLAALSVWKTDHSSSDFPFVHHHARPGGWLIPAAQLVQTAKAQLASLPETQQRFWFGNVIKLMTAWLDTTKSAQTSVAEKIAQVAYSKMAAETLFSALRSEDKSTHLLAEKLLQALGMAADETVRWTSKSLTKTEQEEIITALEKHLMQLAAPDAIEMA